MVRSKKDREKIHIIEVFHRTESVGRCSTVIVLSWVTSYLHWGRNLLGLSFLAMLELNTVNSNEINLLRTHKLPRHAGGAVPGVVAAAYCNS